MKYFIWSMLALTVLVVSSGCSSNPVKDRLEKNLVYQCSLEMLGKSVAAADAERICSSAHKAEMEERHFTAGLRAGARPAQPVRSPASAEVHVPPQPDSSGVERPSAEPAND